VLIGPSRLARFDLDRATGPKYSVISEAIELTQGMVVVAVLAIVGPIAVVGAGFIAWGRLRQTVDDLKAQSERLHAADAAHTDRLRAELDAHAAVLAARLDNSDAMSREARREIWNAVRSLQRWRERMRGAEEARAAAQSHRPARPPTPSSGVVPQHFMGPDQTTPVHVVPPPTPKIHRSSTRYPAALEESTDGDDKDS